MKRTFSILLIVSLLATLFMVPSMAEAPSLVANGLMFSPLNYTTLADSNNTINASKLRISGNTTDIFKEKAVGKMAGDYALAFSQNQYILDYNFLSGMITPDTTPAKSAVHYQWQFAVDSNAAVGTEHRFTTQKILNKDKSQYTEEITVPCATKTTTHVIDFTVGDSKNTVELFDEFSVDFTWNKGQWYTVDVLITKGQYADESAGKEEILSYMTILVDGAPLTLSDGKTLDGVKRTTERFLIDACNDNTKYPGIQPFIGAYYNSNIRFETASKENSVIYIDNLKAYVYNADSSNYAESKTYVKDVLTDSDGGSDVVPNLAKSNNAVYTVGEEADGNKFLKPDLGTTAGTALGYLNFRWGQNNIASYDKMLVEADVMRTSTNVDYWVTEEQSGAHAFGIGDTRDKSADGSKTFPIYYASMSTSAYTNIDNNEKLKKDTVDTWLNQWVKHTLLVDIAENNYQTSVNGMESYTAPQVLPKSYGSGAGMRLAATFTSSANLETDYVGYDNFKILGLNYYPTIKSVSYKQGESVATDDYLVPVATDTLVLDLKGKIFDTSAENIAKIVILDENGNALNAQNTYNEEDNTLTIILSQSLKSNDRYEIKIPADFVVSPANGDKAAVTMESAYSYGFKTAYKPFETKSVYLKSKIYDKSTETWAADFTNHTYGYIVDKSYISAEINMTNTTGIPQSCVAILGIYTANDRLVSCEVKSKTIPADGSDNTITFDGISYYNWSGCKVKAFVWDSINGMQPINNSFYLWHNIGQDGGVSAEGTTPRWE